MKTPLVQAIDKNDPALVNLLITLGANVNTASHYTRRTPLMAAVALGHLSVASLLIDKGCSVNATDINGLNVLHYAVDSNNLDSVEFVLKQGLHVDAQDSSGWTPLMRAGDTGDSHVTHISRIDFFYSHLVLWQRNRRRIVAKWRLQDYRRQEWLQLRQTSGTGEVVNQRVDKNIAQFIQRQK
jgi:hypothetical protein